MCCGSGDKGGADCCGSFCCWTNKAPAPAVTGTAIDPDSLNGKEFKGTFGDHCYKVVLGKNIWQGHSCSDWKYFLGTYSQTTGTPGKQKYINGAGNCYNGGGRASEVEVQAAAVSSPSVRVTENPTCYYKLTLTVPNSMVQTTQPMVVQTTQPPVRTTVNWEQLLSSTFPPGFIIPPGLTLPPGVTFPPGGITTDSVMCGNHRAPSCAECHIGQQVGNERNWCSGECWWNEKIQQCGATPSQEELLGDTVMNGLAEAGEGIGKMWEAISGSSSAMLACCCLCFCFCRCLRNGCKRKEKLAGDDDEESDVDLPYGATCPEYWANQDPADTFDYRYEQDDLIPVVQQMFDTTWKNIVTRDRKGSAPSRLEVVSVQRFEDSKMWAAYLEQKEKIKKRGTIESVLELDGDFSRGHVVTDGFVSHLTQGGQLDQSLNEHYLFHGTSPEAAENIAEDGFRINLAGSSTGTMFGRGAYFGECSSKADEYAVAGGGDALDLGFRGFHQQEDEFAILLCRVCCGKMFRALRSSDKSQIEPKVHRGEIDGVLGDREAAAGTYREFVVFKESQIYPEYRVLYNRVYDYAVE
jgi:hypothetical protein